MVTLTLQTDHMTDDEGYSYVGYGIAVFDGEKELFSVPDISTVRQDVENFVNLCNTLGVSEVHIMELVEDLVADIN